MSGLPLVKNPVKLKETKICSEKKRAPSGPLIFLRLGWIDLSKSESQGLSRPMAGANHSSILFGEDIDHRLTAK